MPVTAIGRDLPDSSVLPGGRVISKSEAAWQSHSGDVTSHCDLMA